MPGLCDAPESTEGFDRKPSSTPAGEVTTYSGSGLSVALNGFEWLSQIYARYAVSLQAESLEITAVKTDIDHYIYFLCLIFITC